MGIAGWNRVSDVALVPGWARVFISLENPKKKPYGFYRIFRALVATLKNP
jgi:hypothetical protein